MPATISEAPPALSAKRLERRAWVEKARRRAGWKALSVHIYTASGLAMAFLAAAEIASQATDPRRAFGWMIAATLIDATDGPLARRWKVKRRAPQFDGRKIDDIVDYLTFSFLPLLLIWDMGWLPAPASLWVCLAMMASVFGFAHSEAKQESAGFFQGFPSYWNIFAFYAGLMVAPLTVWSVWALLMLLTVLSVAPVRFLYPNLAPRPWRGPLLWGAFVWLAILLAMLPTYPQAPVWLWGASLIYPVFYAALSIHLDLRDRQAQRIG